LLRWWLSGRTHTTYGVYRSTARQFLAFLGKPLSDARIEDILLWLESFQLRGFSPNTVNNKLAAIKSLFSFGVKTGYLDANPARLVKSIPAPDALHERLLDESEMTSKYLHVRPHECSSHFIDLD
jgi:site-specific recombinase XerD